MFSRITTIVSQKAFMGAGAAVVAGGVAMVTSKSEQLRAKMLEVAKSHSSRVFLDRVAAQFDEIESSIARQFHSEIIPLKSVVIVGCGPIGIYTAIKLKELGISVKVIDPRIGQFVRPGAIVSSTYNGMFGSISDFEMPGHLQGQDHIHIKEIEKALYQHATKMGIEFEAKKFDGFDEDGSMKVVNQNGERGNYKCDTVIDATGGARRVIAAVNEKTKGNEAFTVQDVLNVGPQQHCAKYIKLKDITSFKAVTSNAQNDANEEILDILGQFGWQEEYLPHLDFYEFGKEKAIAYARMPMDLKAPEKQLPSKAANEFLENISTDPHALKKAWLAALIYCAYGQDIPFSEPKENGRYGKKMNTMTFILNSTMIQEDLFAGEKAQLPVVIPVGDANFTPDYRTAYGIVSGHRRSEHLVEAIQSRGMDFDKHAAREGDYVLHRERYADGLKEILEGQKGLTANAHCTESGREIDEVLNNNSIVS